MALQNLRYSSEAGDVPLVEGKLQLQSEAGEVFYKGIEIRPIEQMPEEYLPYFEWWHKKQREGTFTVPSLCLINIFGSDQI